MVPERPAGPGIEDLFPEREGIMVAASKNPKGPDGELEKSVRAGAYSNLADADRAVAGLLAAGFPKEEITVVCSDESRERHFREFEHQKPAGENAGGGVAAGATIGALAGGLTAIAVGAASGVVPLVIAGAAGVSAGSTVGGFLGAMATRGGEKSVSDFYDQAVRRGDILVSVEEHGAGSAARLRQAERIITAAGAETVKLPEG